MVEILFPQYSTASLPPAKLIGEDEVIAVVDDSPEIVLLLSHYLNNQGLTVVRAGSAHDLLNLLGTMNVALVLLDIGLPDRNGNEILPEIVPAYPDLGIIMVTGTTDIQMALECLRHGADDYLTKPVNIDQFNHTVLNTLKKRRLTINHRLFQKELQKTNSRMKFLHHLNLKLNTAYLNTYELQTILKAILVAITADGGLRFNRAFLALYDDKNDYLTGKLAIGPSSREEAGRVWQNMEEEGVQLENLLESISTNNNNDDDTAVNKIVRSLKVPTDNQEHVLIHASRCKKSIHVLNGSAENCQIPEELIQKLQQSTFVVVPLYSPTKSLGVIIVDNYVTNAHISSEDIKGLEIFASQASIAIEHSHLYENMAEKISALETVTNELERSKDLLVEAERTATIGQISSQLLHAIRNPVTSIGGTSRLLSKKTKDQYLLDFLSIITKEANKIELILEDIFSFVEDTQLALEPHHIFSLLQKCVLVFYTAIEKQNIEYTFEIGETGPILEIDKNKLRQVFLNLLRNSIEAMEQGGSLIISSEENEHYVKISIIDSGKGIPTDILPHVKDPFFTTKTYGNGMGLALVDQIIQAHGGEFTIESNPPSGTRAIVSLPKTVSH